MIQPLAEVIEAEGLAPCLFVRVRCQKCGDQRIAISDTPGRYYGCPQCSTQAPCTLLGIGGTRRTVPFFQAEAKYWMDPIERMWMAHRARSASVGRTG